MDGNQLQERERERERERGYAGLRRLSVADIILVGTDLQTKVTRSACAGQHTLV